MSPALPARIPDLEATPDLDWVLRAAFLKATVPFPIPTGAVAMALSLGLGERIWARHGPDLPDQADQDAGQPLRLAHHRAAALGMLHLELAERLGEVGERESIPLVLLKGTALLAAGDLEPGARIVTDLDVLVPEPQAAAFQRLLIETGAREEDEPGTEHHLPRLAFPTGAALDIHVRLPGLKLGTPRRDATYDLLEEAGGMVPLESFGAGVSRPSRRSLAAHLLVHGFEQHLLRSGYPLMRAVGDLADLLADDDDWSAFERQFGDATELAVPLGLRRSVRSLVRALKAGGLVDELASSPDEPASRLLRHIVATATRPDYTESLRWLHRWRKLSASARQGEAASHVRRKLQDWLR